MELIIYILHIVLHLDKYLGLIISWLGFKTYIVLFLIIFIGGAFIITPFLPGNSLLFISGTFAALESLNVYVLVISLLLASILGGSVNYHIGRFLGEKIINNKIGKLILKPKYIEKTNEFYKRNGGKTLILSKYVPIVRTFASFMAGMGKMSYKKFVAYNILGSILWVIPMNMIGYLFGNMPFVKNNYSFVMGILIMVYIIIGVLTFIRYIIRNRNRKLEIRNKDNDAIEL
ncbi:VTT domain-containing protein [Hathewaya limosa]|uniref:Membrane-associated protein n=1 Tax=Hathewaya limosa TaxID=1536 RepID=A0ABU0JTY5_HATLI|nr:VTT domain-containing protein [Hathewaya limosa]MDQ0480555.1 membrane-associated protein [Hathewaya limosa]